MCTEVSMQGQVVIPTELRAQSGIARGDVVDVRAGAGESRDGLYFGELCVGGLLWG